MKKISPDDLKASAKWFKYVSPRHPDADYNMPTIKWVKETFIPFYFAWLMEHKINTYDLKFDCDDFSTWFRERKERRSQTSCYIETKHVPSKIIQSSLQMSHSNSTINY